MNIRKTCLASVSVLGASLAMACASAIPAAAQTVAGPYPNWSVFGTTIEPDFTYTHDESKGQGTGVHTAQPGTTVLANTDLELSPQPYLLAGASLGVDSNGSLHWLSSASVSLTYDFVIQAQTAADAQKLVNYMTNVSPLRGDSSTAFGLGYVVQGASFVNISQDVPNSYSMVAGVDVHPALLGDPFYDDVGFSRLCDGNQRDPVNCDAYDSLGQPIMTNFSTLGSLWFTPGDVNFYGRVTLDAFAGGQSQNYTFTTATAIIDPVIHLPDDFTGNPNQFTFTLSPGVGGAPVPLPPPPPPPPEPAGVPEPATWSMLLLGLGGLGAAVRLRRLQGLAAAV